MKYDNQITAKEAREFSEINAEFYKDQDKDQIYDAFDAIAVAAKDGRRIVVLRLFRDPKDVVPILNSLGFDCSEPEYTDHSDSTRMRSYWNVNVKW